MPEGLLESELFCHKKGALPALTPSQQEKGNLGLLREGLLCLEFPEFSTEFKEEMEIIHSNGR
ncbi:MAG: hypothetical protein FJ240_09025 [Nitrospira sp.]|nr:hypothetical protein [Nitrospira sp.]